MGVPPKATEVLVVGRELGLLAPGQVARGSVAVVPGAHYPVTLARMHGCCMRAKERR